MSELRLETTNETFEGRTAHQIKADLNGTGHNGSFNVAYAGWSDVGTQFADIGSYIDSALKKAAGAHSGAASDASQGAVAPLAEYARQGQAQAEAIRDVMSGQQLTQLAVENDTPEGQDSPPGKQGFEHILPSGWTGHGDRMDAYEEENRTAREAMTVYQNETNARLLAVPVFEEPPEVGYSAKSSTPTDVSLGQDNRISTPSGGSTNPGTGGSGGGGFGGGWTPPGESGPGGSGGSGPGGGGGSPIGSAPGISPDGYISNPTPSNPVPGAGGGFSPTPPGGPLQPGPGGFIPGGGPGGIGNPGGPGGHAGGPGGRMPGGPGGFGGGRMPGGPGGGRPGGFGGLGGGPGGPGGGRMPGGFGPGGAGGFGPGGSGGFGPGGSGGPGANGFGPGGSTGAAGPGGRMPGGFGPAGGGFGPGGGAGGGMAGGGGGAGGRGGQGEEDKEHKRADYLLETEDVFGDGIKVAPAVFGENPPGYGR